MSTHEELIASLEALGGVSVSPEHADAITYQATVQVITLAMHNVVAQQQHANILRNALTTAAVKGLLNADQASLELVREALTPDATTRNLRQLVTLLEEVKAVLRPTTDEGAKQ